MNIKHGLFTLGISLITAGIGFIVGSKWTEKEIKQRTEDFYAKEYELLKKSYEERKEGEIRADQQKKDTEMVAEVEKMREGIRRCRHEVDWDDEEELEEFGGKTEDEFDEESEERELKGPGDRPSNLCRSLEEQNRYDALLYRDRKAHENGHYCWIISYDEYWDAKDREEHSLTYDVNTEHLWDDDDPERELEPDALVSMEALEILAEGYSDKICVQNIIPYVDYVITRFDPRD